MRCHVPILAIALGAAAPGWAAELCLRDTAWGPQLAPYDQKMSFELISRTDERSLVGIRFSPLSGTYAKLFGFFRFEGDCVTRALIVGAFASANDFRNVEDLPKGAPVRYHEDFVTGAGQNTLDVTTRPPAYGTVRALAIGMLE